VSLTLEQRKSRIFGLSDLLLFILLSPFFLVMFYLSSFNDQPMVNTIFGFFAMWAASTIGILFYMHTYGEPELGAAYRIDFDENLNLRSIIVIVGGIIALFVIAMVFATLKTGLFFIPFISTVPAISILDPVKRVASEGAWQIFNVAYGEEMLKLVAILALTQRFQSLGDPYREIFGAGIPIVGWAMLHAQLAYAGDMIMTTAAGCAGVVLYIQMRTTKSVLVSIITHGTYNTILAVMLFEILGKVI